MGKLCEVLIDTGLTDTSESFKMTYKRAPMSVKHYSEEFKIEVFE